MRATAPLERSVQMRTAQPVDEDAYARSMGDAALAWTDEERLRLQPALDGLEPVLARLVRRPSKQILLVKAKPDLQDGLPHTRANAIVLPEGFERTVQATPAAVMAHELFHILSRDDAALRERLYAAIGFKPCASVQIPPEVEGLRVTNPDAPQHRHSIAIRYRGRAADAMPYPRLASDRVEPTLGFRKQIQAKWLLVERSGASCKALGVEPDPAELEGLYEQIGSNTRYLWHPEEILADNFALLVLGLQQGMMPEVPSPDVLARLAAILVRQ